MNAEAALRSKDGKEEWTLSYGFNALCRLEQELGMSADKFANEIASGKSVKLVNMRAMIWAGLKDHHPDISLEVTGDIIDKVGMVETLQIAAGALVLAFPEYRGEVNPQKAIKGGTSKRS